MKKPIYTEQQTIFFILSKILRRVSFLSLDQQHNNKYLIFFSKLGVAAWHLRDVLMLFLKIYKIVLMSEFIIRVKSEPYVRQYIKHVYFVPGFSFYFLHFLNYLCFFSFLLPQEYIVRFFPHIVFRQKKKQIYGYNSHVHNIEKKFSAINDEKKQSFSFDSIKKQQTNQHSVAAIIQLDQNFLTSYQNVRKDIEKKHKTSLDKFFLQDLDLSCFQRADKFNSVFFSKINNEINQLEAIQEKINQCKAALKKKPSTGIYGTKTKSIEERSINSLNLTKDVKKMIYKLQKTLPKMDRAIIIINGQNNKQIRFFCEIIENSLNKPDSYKLVFEDPITEKRKRNIIENMEKKMIGTTKLKQTLIFFFHYNSPIFYNKKIKSIIDHICFFFIRESIDKTNRFLVITNANPQRIEPTIGGHIDFIVNIKNKNAKSLLFSKLLLKMKKYKFSVKYLIDIIKFIEEKKVFYKIHNKHDYVLSKEILEKLEKLLKTKKNLSYEDMVIFLDRVLQEYSLRTK